MYRSSESSEERLLALLRASLPEHRQIFFAGDIPPDKHETVVRTYRLFDEERVLALYDDTIFGSAEDGFVFTTGHFGFKELGQGPVLIDLRRLPRQQVELWQGALYIKRGKLAISPGAAHERVVAGVHEALLGMMELLQQEPIPATVTPGLLRSPGELLRLLRAELPAHCDLYYRGRIPAGKLKTVTHLYQLADPDEVLVLYDDTLFGSAAEGFLFTPTHFGFKELGSPPVLLALDALEREHVERDGQELRVKGRRVEITGATVADIADSVERILLRIAEAPPESAPG